MKRGEESGRGLKGICKVGIARAPADQYNGGGHIPPQVGCSSGMPPPLPGESGWGGGYFFTQILLKEVKPWMNYRKRGLSC